MDFLVNLASNIATILLIVLAGWIVHVCTGRRDLLAFFHVGKAKRLVLYLSNLRVQQGGTVGLDNRPRAFSSNAIPAYEANLIPVYQRLFNFVIPGVRSQPGFLKWLLISDVELEVMAAPLSDEEIEASDTFVAFGSPGYNLASKVIEERLGSVATIGNDATAIHFEGREPFVAPDFGFVQRVRNQETGQIAYYVAGIAILGTTGAAFYLASHWKELRRTYGDSEPFCILLRVDASDPRRSTVIALDNVARVDPP